MVSAKALEQMMKLQDCTPPSVRLPFFICRGGQPLTITFLVQIPNADGGGVRARWELPGDAEDRVDEFATASPLATQRT
jgi:hypothetical protein